MRYIKSLNSKGFKKYIFNTGWLLIDKILKLVLGIIVGFWVARFLGPKDFGVLSYAQALVAMLASFSTFGLNEILVREFLYSKIRKEELIGTSICIRFIGSIVALILLFATYIYSGDKNSNSIVLIVGFSILFQSFKVLEYYLHSMVLGRSVAISNIIALFFSSILKVVLIFQNASVVWFAWVLVLESVFVFLGLLYHYLKVNRTIEKWQVKFTVAKNLLLDSWPLILSSLLISVYMKIDQVMIKSLLNDTEVGIYAAAVRLSEAWGFIPATIIASMFPAIILSKNNQTNDIYNTRIQYLYSLMITLALIVAIPMSFLSNNVIALCYGNDYIRAGDVLSIHIWSCVFIFVGGASSKWLLVENLQKYFAINTAIGAVINVGLNFVFIKRYGIVGAAWSTLISYGVAAYFSLLLWRKTRINFYNVSKGFLILSLMKMHKKI